MLMTENMPFIGITNPLTQNGLLTDPHMSGLKDQPERSDADGDATHLLGIDTKMSKKSKRALKKKQKAALKQPLERRGDTVTEAVPEQSSKQGQESVTEEEVEQWVHSGNSDYLERSVGKRGQRETRPRQPAARYILDWVSTFKHCAPDMASMERAEQATDIVGVMGTARGRPFQTRLLEYPEPHCNPRDDQSSLDGTLKDESDHKIGSNEAPKDDSGGISCVDVLKDDSTFQTSFDNAFKDDSSSQTSCDSSFKDDSSSQTSFDDSPTDNSGSRTSYDGSVQDHPRSEVGYDDALKLVSGHESRESQEDKAEGHQSQPDLGADSVPYCESGPTEKALQYMKSVLERWAHFTGSWQSEPTLQKPEAQDDLFDTDQPCQLIECHFYDDAPRPDLHGLEGVWLSAALRRFEREQMYKSQIEDMESDIKEPAHLSHAETTASIHEPDLDAFATRLEIPPPQSALPYSIWDDFYPTATRLGALLSQVTVLTVEFPDLSAGFGDLTAGLYDPFAHVRTARPQEDTHSAASDDEKLPNEQQSGLQSNVRMTSNTSAIDVIENTKPNIAEPESSLKRKHTPMISRESNRPKKLKGKEVQVFVLRPKT